MVTQKIQNQRNCNVESALCVLPQNFTAPNTRLGNRLFKDSSELLSGEDFLFSPFGLKNHVRIKCNFNLLSSQTGFLLSWYDKAVYNAICSIYQEKKSLKLLTRNGNVAITYSNIYGVLVGHTCTPSHEQLRTIGESISKLRMVSVRIDYTAQVPTNKGTPPTSAIIEDYLLNAAIVALTVRGVETSGIILRAEPILYTYAQETHHQLFSVPTDLLSVRIVEKSAPGKEVLGAFIQNTTTSIMLRHYLLWRIGYSQDNYKQNRIVLSNLTDELSLPTDTRTQQQRIRSLCLQIFDYLQYFGIIKSFKLEMEGHKFVAIQFETQKSGQF